MSYEGLSGLLEEVCAARASLDQGDARTNHRLEQLETSINDLYRNTARPGTSTACDDEVSERKDAIGLCIARHNLTVPKNDGHTTEYVPAHAEIDAAVTARKALRSLWRHGDASRLDPAEKKSLSSFSFGTNAFILPPTMSDMLSCLIDPSDLSGLVAKSTSAAVQSSFLSTT